MLNILLNALASAAILLQYLLEHFTESKRRKRLMGLVIGALAISGIWGSYSLQNNETFGVTTRLDSIRIQYDSVKILARDLSLQLRHREEVLRDVSSKYDSLKRKLNIMSSVAPKLDPSGRIELSPGVSVSSEFDEGAKKARDLFDKGNFDEAFRLAQELANKNAEFGLAYFIMGTVDAQKNTYADAKTFLLKAIRLGLTKSDEAWAYHNLGVVSLRQNRLQDAIDYLKRALAANPAMEQSRQLLNQIPGH